MTSTRPRWHCGHFSLTSCTKASSDLVWLRSRVWCSCWWPWNVVLAPRTAAPIAEHVPNCLRKSLNVWRSRLPETARKQRPGNRPTYAALNAWLNMIIWWTCLLAYNPKPHRWLTMPRKESRALLRRGIDPYDNRKQRWPLGESLALSTAITFANHTATRPLARRARRRSPTLLARPCLNSAVRVQYVRASPHVPINCTPP